MADAPKQNLTKGRNYPFTEKDNGMIPQKKVETKEYNFDLIMDISIDLSEKFMTAEEANLYTKLVEDVDNELFNILSEVRKALKFGRYEIEYTLTSFDDRMTRLLLDRLSLLHYKVNLDNNPISNTDNVKSIILHINWV